MTILLSLALLALDATIPSYCLSSMLECNASVKIFTQAFIQHDAGLNQVKASGLDALIKAPHLGPQVNTCVPILL